MKFFALGSRIRAVMVTAGGAARPRRQASAITLAVAVGAPLALGQVMGIWSAPDVLTWYPKLTKPSWTPPVWLFGPTWGLLYTLMGLASHRVWQAGGGPLPLGLYVAQLGLNLAWQPLFFKTHDLEKAKKDIDLLIPVVIATVWQFYKVDKGAAKLMLPYLAFSIFAAALTHSIRSMNPRQMD